MAEGSSRLESLNRSGSSNSRPKIGLKFKPKVVSRRSEQERAASAPKIKQEFDKSKRDFAGRGGRGGRGGGRGRGAFRGGRGGAFIKTELISSGPLSSANFTSGTPNGSRFQRVDMVHSSSPTPEYFTNLKKEQRARSKSLGISSDDEDDESDHRLDVNKDFEIENDTISSLFPLRPLQFQNLSHSDSSEESLVDMKNMEDVKVKTETTDSLKDIEAKEKHKIKSSDDPATNFEEVDENEVILKESRKIVNIINKFSKTDEQIKEVTDDQQPINDLSNKFVTLQLPRKMPTFINEDNIKEGENTAEDLDKIINESTEGQIGSLKIHKSGRLTLQFGEITFDVTRSVNNGFLQDLVLCEYPDDGTKNPTSDTGVKKENDEDIDMEQEDSPPPKEGKLYQLGQVTEKLVSIPRIL